MALVWYEVKDENGINKTAMPAKANTPFQPTKTNISFSTQYTHPHQSTPQQLQLQ